MIERERVRDRGRESEKERKCSTPVGRRVAPSTHSCPTQHRQHTPAPRNTLLPLQHTANTLCKLYTSALFFGTDKAERKPTFSDPSTGETAREKDTPLCTVCGHTHTHTHTHTQT